MHSENFDCIESRYCDVCIILIKKTHTGHKQSGTLSKNKEDEFPTKATVPRKARSNLIIDRLFNNFYVSEKEIRIGNIPNNVEGK